MICRSAIQNSFSPKTYKTPCRFEKIYQITRGITDRNSGKTEEAFSERIRDLLLFCNPAIPACDPHARITRQLRNIPLGFYRIWQSAFTHFAIAQAQRIMLTTHEAITRTFSGQRETKGSSISKRFCTIKAIYERLSTESVSVILLFLQWKSRQKSL